jgi:hypothetical protein
MRTLMMVAMALAIALGGCGGDKQTGCKPMPCPSPCGGVGYKSDPKTGCRLSCECNGTPVSCPALSCSETCGLGQAAGADGCPTCSCCYPADCVDGCHATGDDGCPTCVAC